MKYSKIPLLAMAALVFSSCTLTPEVDLRIQSVEPISLTVTAAGQTVTVTVEVRNGVDIEIQGYSLVYHYYDTNNKKRDIDITHRADFTSSIEGGSYEKGSWEISTGTIDVTVTYSDIIDFAQNNNLEQVVARIYIRGMDLNGNSFEINDAYVTLYF